MILRSRVAGSPHAERVVALVFFAAAFVSFADPIDTGDFWWHLLTGRWIFEHGTLPGTDPFTYTVPQDSDLRRQVILRGYWLSQLSIYLVQRAAGFAGVVLARAAFFTGLFWVLWRIVRWRGVAPIFALLLIAPLPLICQRFVETRPQAVSFLFVLLSFLILEHGIEGLRQGRGPGVLLWMPPLMLVWANAHRGYLLGHLLLGLYVLAEAWRFFLARDSLAPRAMLTLTLMVAASFGASLLNPDPLGALLVTFQELRSPFLQTIDEFLPIWTYARWNPDRLLLPGMLAIAAGAIAVLAASWRTLQWRHALLVLGCAAAGLRSFRFSIFLALVAVAVASGYLPPAWRAARGRARWIAAAAVIAMAVLLVSASVERNAWPRRAIRTEALPVAAADFIAARRLPGPLFNPFEWGGYLGWRLHPDHKLFVDSRNLDAGVLDRYLQAKESGHRRVFDEYGVNCAVFYPVNPGSGKIPAVVLTLMVDESWSLVHLDDLALVFVRASANGGLPIIEKRTLALALERRAEDWRRESPGDARPFVMLGGLALARGDVAGARNLFSEALLRDPDHPEARRLLDRIEAREAESPQRN